MPSPEAIRLRASVPIEPAYGQGCTRCFLARLTASAAEPVSAPSKFLTAAISLLHGHRPLAVALARAGRKTSLFSHHIEYPFNQYRRKDTCFQSRSALMMKESRQRG